MRHQKKGFKLGRTSSHRKATLAALSNALIQHKRITTTLTKARALRMYVEPLINRSKEDTMHSRRQVFRHLQNKETVTELFSEIRSRVAERPGGYTRVIKLGQRAGDSAEMAIIELVDYNDVKPFGSSDSKKKRTRRAGRKRMETAVSEAVGAEGLTTDIADELDEVSEVETEEISEIEVEEVDSTEPGSEEASVKEVSEPAAEEVAKEDTPEAVAAEEDAAEETAEPAAEKVAKEDTPEPATEEAPEPADEDEEKKE